MVAILYSFGKVRLRAGKIVEDREITDADRRPDTLATLLAKAA